MSKKKPYEIINIGEFYHIHTQDSDLYITCASVIFSNKEDAEKFAEKVHNPNNKWAFADGRLAF